MQRATDLLRPCRGRMRAAVFTVRSSPRQFGSRPGYRATSSTIPTRTTSTTRSTPTSNPRVEIDGVRWTSFRDPDRGRSRVRGGPRRRRSLVEFENRNAATAPRCCVMLLLEDDDGNPLDRLEASIQGRRGRLKRPHRRDVRLSTKSSSFDGSTLLRGLHQQNVYLFCRSRTLIE